MKKKLWVLLSAVVLLSALGMGFALPYLLTPLSYEQIAGNDYSLPAKEAHRISILQVGDFPGMRDDPVTAEEAAPGQKALNALRNHKYTRTLPIHSPRNGGIGIRKISGCTPESAAYWDGKYLWVPQDFERPWRGYLPSDPDMLDKTLRSLCK